MFRNVFLKTLRDMRTSLFWWVIGMFLTSLYVMTIYPSIQKSQGQMQDYINNLPAGFKAMFGGSVIDLSTPEGFLSVELFSFFYPLLVLAFAVTYGAGFIGSEEDAGTLDLLLATPIRRWRVMFDKFAALVVFMGVVLLSVFLGILAGGAIAGVESMDLGNMLAGVINMAPLGLFFAALALCLTGVRGGRGLALGVVLGAAAITYLVNTMASVTDIPLWLQRLSPWYYYNGTEVVLSGLNAGDMGLLLGLSVVLVGIGMWGFQRRDVGV